MTSQNDNDDPNYKVGYGKPPLHSRFQKGKRATRAAASRR
jgi:hypothetical protein